MIYRIKSIVYNNLLQIKNFGYLSLLKIFILFIPLITYPYLIRIIGKELWGEVIFAQVIISYCTLLINFGYDISATREVSIQKNSKYEISKIVSSVYISKLILLLLAAVIMFFLFIYVPYIRLNYQLYAYTFLICVGDVLFPMWFFLGIERMKYITFINLSIKVLFLLFVFIFVKNKEDYILVPFFNGLGSVIGGVVAMGIVFAKFGVRFVSVKFIDIVNRVKASFNFFITDVSVALKDRLNILIIGSFMGFSEVAYYDLGTKIVHLAQTPFTIINNVLLPSFSANFNKRKLRTTITIFTIISLLVCILLMISANFIVLKLGGIEMVYTSNIIYVYSVVIPIACFSSICGVALASQGFSKNYMLADIYAFVMYFIIILLLIFFNLTNIYSFLVSIIISVIFTVMYKYNVCKKNQLI